LLASLPNLVCARSTRCGARAHLNATPSSSRNDYEPSVLHQKRSYLCDCSPVHSLRVPRRCALRTWRKLHGGIHGRGCDGGTFCRVTPALQPAVYGSQLYSCQLQPPHVAVPASLCGRHTCHTDTGSSCIVPQRYCLAKQCASKFLLQQCEHCKRKKCLRTYNFTHEEV
jgi:hypothetical protein